MFLNSIKNTLVNTKSIITKKLNEILNKNQNTNILEDITNLLIECDIGMKTTEKIVNTLSKKKLHNKTDYINEISNILLEMLNNCEHELKIDTNIKPFVILIVGVNGVGKTSTIGKLSKIYKNLNKEVIIAAGDTFRAAGIEQLQKICDQTNTNLIKQHYGTDSASVIYDALSIAKKKKTDILIADTAGRLHNNQNLMNELKKIVHVIKKIDNTAPHEIMLILDATFGQNSLIQAQKFNDYLKITGITITKLDGTSKAGIIFPIANLINIPIRYICIGEKIDDIKVFNAKNFVNSILERRN
ncbi:MAG: signal recognition particle-docking protein FtsY [Enterobacteriaceae bacterium]|nr:signal recognition particle-docking protein FtsY [Enterobacteriaceae bacterium]